MSMAGRVCVVTGSSRGLGRAVAGHLAAQGAALALCARDERLLAIVADELRDQQSATVHAVAADVSDAVAMQEFARSTEARLGPAYAVINNAGVLGPVGPIDGIDPFEWRDALAVNVLGVVHTMRAFVPQMVARGNGVVLNVLGGGVGGNGVQSFIDAYTASKAAIAALTETTGKELAPRGVRVNAFSPGPLATELMRPVLDAGPTQVGDVLFEKARAIYDRPPLTDELGPEIAELVDFLLGPKSVGLTGRLLSAQWNPVERLQQEMNVIAETSRYRLRRIDGEFFLARDGT